MNHQQKIGTQPSASSDGIQKLRRRLADLEAERDSYAQLFAHAPVGYFILSREGRIRAVNLMGAGMLGEPVDALPGRDFAHFVAADAEPGFADFLRRVFAEPLKQTYRLRLARPRSAPRHVRIEALADLGNDQCRAVLVDISEKQRAEQALAESEYNLAKAQAMTHVGSWSFDPATGEVQASAELLRILRLRPEETTQEAFARVVHPEDYDNVLAHLRMGVEQGKSYEIEHRLLFDDGRVHWVYSIVEPSLNIAGQVIKLYGTTQDITQRKQAEVDLRNKTNELQTIFDSIGDGIMVYDSDGRVQHHNLISPRLFPHQSLPGKSCREIFHPEAVREPEQCPVEKALKGERVDTSLVHAAEGLRPRYLEITATPIRDALGEENRALVFLRDVSEKRLQEMHLIQTEKMSSIGVLATGIAHEINNPLTSVAGCAEALLRRFRDEPTLKEHDHLDVFPHYLEVIVRESYRCKDIINHLLSFGRKSDGSAVLVDVNLVLLEILELLRYQSTFRKIRILTDLGTDLPRVSGDPSGLRQVFMNLLVNACQAIEDQGVVDVRSARADDDRIRVVIRDTGSGMAQQIRDRIWEPFFTTKDVGQGVGLGLALSYNIVKRHGGEIQLDSRIGEGSQFTVLLPIKPEGRS
ncbi:PAS domain-containing protein [Geoalkalibacter halelectricus]|uniref:histidine kinase n=1 Tax=Geoalkalibacter halelectricus TaxID=2847045 RepID=A0ABY5ZIF5_9BACT|nr:PAS domain-containing protein [Geoalkalibacter halelectricus]MDO3377262.1 PAS domain-containing protein [Geoalkalibacter halelectricus]UWZ78901.1 PAS domain-containing protein [Geoalkalibacter halelectricus]